MQTMRVMANWTVSPSRTKISGTWLLLLDTWSLRTDIWLLRTDTWILLTDTWLLLTYTWSLLVDNWSLLTNTRSDSSLFDPFIFDRSSKNSLFLSRVSAITFSVSGLSGFKGGSVSPSLLDLLIN
uniref:Uncharacterized protein n=1 Tax=Cacopsylla melanoneura TaxID=428564 RepID=A0A8D8QAK6_9HEMI